MADAAAASRQSSDFVAELEAANLHPLWDRFRTLTPVKPQAKDPPLLWRWKDIEPFTDRAVTEASLVPSYSLLAGVLKLPVTGFAVMFALAVSELLTV